MNRVSSHNCKSQKVKLSVSNPKSNYVACLPVLSQISNCQSLGRKNKHEILKTDRNHVIIKIIIIIIIIIITITIMIISDNSNNNNNITSLYL